MKILLLLLLKADINYEHSLSCNRDFLNLISRFLAYFLHFFPLDANKALVVARRSFPSGLQPGKELDRPGMSVNVCC